MPVAGAIDAAAEVEADRERTRFVLEGSDDGYWDWDVASGRVQVNRRWWLLRGMEPQEGGLQVEDWSRTLHPEDLPATMRALERHLSGEMPAYRAEYRVMRPDGSCLWVSDRGKVVARDGAGAPTRVCGVNSNIDEYRQLTAQLADSHRMLSAVQKLQREFIRSQDLRAQCERMLKLALETSDAGYGFIAEVRRDDDGTPYLKTHAMTDIAWDDATRVLYQVHLARGLEFRNLRTLFGHSLRTGEVVVSNRPSADPRSSGTPGGHPPMHNYMGIPIFSNDEMVGMLAMANRNGGFDASLAQQLEPLLSTFAVMLQAHRVESDRSQAIVKAVEAESRLRRITNGVPGAVFQCLGGHGRIHRIGFLSDGVQDLLGVSADSLVEQPRRLLRLLAREDRRALRGMVAASSRAGLPWAFEFCRRNADGSPRWLRIAAQCLALGAGEFEWNGMLVDITAQKRVEADLREAKNAADSASRAKSSFLATMSHEIRTPMHAMLGFLELLSESPLDREQSDKVRVVRESGESLLALIDDILDFSRIEADRIELRPTPVDIATLLRRQQDVWTEAALRKNLRLRCDLAPSAAGCYLLDELRVAQILRNLLSNAIKFTLQGEVHLSVAREPGPAPGQSQLVFRVADTGIGVSADAQQRIFRPFEQGDGETTRRFGGSGLGLAISRRLAELMGGTLTLSSEPGRGTLTVLRLAAEAVRAPEARAPASDALPVLPPGFKLLIAEDHAVNQLLLTRQLERLGVQADLAADGAQALERWSRGGYDLLLTDCHMPNMDGFELARRIRAAERQLPGRARIPILAFTADVLPETVEVCKRAGMDDCLSKPMSMRALAQKIAAHLAPAAEPPLPDLDMPALDELTGHDRDLRDTALRLFIDTVPDDVDALRQAIDTQSEAALLRACHRLKGLSTAIAAPRLTAAVLRLSAAAAAPAARRSALDTVIDAADAAAVQATRMLPA